MGLSRYVLEVRIACYFVLPCNLSFASPFQARHSRRHVEFSANFLPGLLLNMSRLLYLLLAVCLIPGAPATQYENIPIETFGRNTAFDEPKSVIPSDPLPRVRVVAPVRPEGQPFCFGPLPDLDISPLIRRPGPVNAKDFYEFPRQLCAEER